MCKKIVYIVICFSMIFPAVSSAGALERYSAPQPQQKAIVTSGNVSEDVYDRFRVEIQDYSPDKKTELIDVFRGKAKQAEIDRNKGAEAHYERLIGIIRASK